MVGDASTKPGRRWTVPVVTAAWAAACVAAFAGLAVHDATPGPAAPARRWPASSRLPRSTTADTLVVVVHPQCPCSRATVDNVAVLMAHCPPGRLATTVVFVRPPGVPLGWERTRLWAAAASIPGVTVVADDGGREAAAFGAQTSGQAMVFDPAGRELFAGGLTVSRGHAGDSGGAAAVRAIALGASPAVSWTPVFGCPLRSPSERTHDARPGVASCRR